MSITNNGRGPAILVFLLLLFGLNATAPGDETTTLAQWSAETWDADISDMWLSGGGNLVNLVRPLVDFDKSQEKTLISAMSDYEIPRTDIDLGRCGVWSKAYSSGTLKLDATMNLGGAAAVLSTGFAPRIETSMATDELHGGQTLVLQTYANVQRSATSITSSFSDIDFGLSGQLASSVRIRVEADGPGIGVDTNILDTSFDTGYDSILTVNHSANEETPLPGGDGILGWAGAAILSSKTGISGTVGKDSATGASVNDAFSATDQSTFVISRQYEYDNMVNAVMDIDSLLPGPPVVGWGFDNVTAGGFTVGGNIVDAKLDYSASVNQNVDASVYAEGRLTVGGGQTVSSYEVYYTNADGDSTLRSSGTNAATIDFHLGDRVEITMPQGDLELTPSYRVAGTLDHTVGIEESFEAQLRLLTLTLGTPKIKLWNGFKVLAWTVGGKTLSWGGIDWEAASLTQSLAGDVTEFQTSMPIGFDSTAFVNAGSFTLTGKAWTIQGNHSFTTDTTIGDDSVYRIGGQLNISGSSDVTVTGTGNVSVDDSVVIGAGSTLTIDDGKLIAGGLDNSAGGTLDFEDGDGTLIIQGGAFDPGKTNLTLGATWSHAWGGTASSPSPTLILAAGSDAEFSGDITVGKEANGDLQVLGGASLKNANTYIGRDRGTWTGPWPNYYEYNWWSTGTAAVDGEGSVWESTGNFYIGGDSNNGGVGTVTVSDGGHLIVGDTLTMWYGGTLNVWDGEVTVGRLYNPGNRGTVNFSGGTLTITNELVNFSGTYEIEAPGGATFRFIDDASWSLASLYVGESNSSSTGVGVLKIEDGSDISCANSLRIGAASTGSGTVIVDGAGSTLNIPSPGKNQGLTIGGAGDGDLIISGGGSVASPVARIGTSATGQGTVFVDGDGSNWYTGAFLNVGEVGWGSVYITDGGSVTSGEACVGGNEPRGAWYDDNGGGGGGYVRVDGADSQWTVNSPLKIGNRGHGQLEITAGGLVSSDGGIIAATSGSGGEVTVSGSDGGSNPSKWDISGDLTVGHAGNGRLRIFDGGRVEAEDSTINIGTVVVSGKGSTWQNSGDLTVKGMSAWWGLTIENGALVSSNTASVTGGVWIGSADGDGASARWMNSGAFNVGGTYQGRVTVDNEGELDVDGTLRIRSNGLLEIASRGSVTAGTFNHTEGGTFDLVRGALTIDGGQLLLPAGAFDLDAAENPSLTFANDGSFTLAGEDLSVGKDHDGTLNIVSGGQVSNAEGAIGAQAGSEGRVTVDGSGVVASTWSNSGALYVARSGRGELSITSGAQVTNTEGYIGHASGASGDVTVDAAGSAWTSSGALQIARDGTAALAVTNGGHVSSASGDIAHTGGSEGTATLTGTGSQWSMGGALDVGRGGTGVVEVFGGAQLASGNAALGRESGASGTVLVDGANSSWTVIGDVDVGLQGDGVLAVANGGALNISGQVRVGVGAGSGDLTWSDGALNASGLVFGANGQLVMGNDFSLLDAQNGSLLGVPVTGLDLATVVIAGGATATLDSGSVTVGALGAGGGGRFEWFGGALSASSLVLDSSAVLAMGQDFDLVSLLDGSLTGGTVTGMDVATLEVTNNKTGTLNSGSASVGHLRVGASTGAMDVTGGADLSTTTGAVGYSVGSHGTMNVDGAGSTWTIAAELCLGHEGAGTLNVLNEGSVSASTTYVGHLAGSQGVLNVLSGSDVSSTDGYIGKDGGSTGTVTVDGAGSTWTASGEVIVGDYGSGRLDITDGGVVSGTVGLVGYHAGSTGDATVSGTSSVWISTGNLYVGDYTDGTLLIDDGGRVENATGTVGNHAGGIGTVTVSDEGTIWANTGDLRVGDVGTGNVIVEGGADVTSDRGYISIANGSEGHITVRDAGSTWATDRYIVVGYEDPGSLTVEDGGAVSVEYSHVGRNNGATGTVTVTGENSSMTNTGELLLGWYSGSHGILNVEAKGSFANGDAYLGKNSGAEGTATVDGSGSLWNNTGSLYAGGSATAGGGTGTITVQNDGQLDVGGTLKLWSGGTLNLTGSGVTVNSFENSAGGALNFTGGELIVDGGTFDPGAGNYTINGSGNPTLTLINGAQANLSANLTVAETDQGTLNVLSGSDVSSTDGYIGKDSGSAGTVTVDGAGSTWMASGDVIVGEYGSGRMDITGGGVVSGVVGMVGYYAGSTGDATVSGSSSAWISTGNLYVGDYTDGTLLITAGGRVENAIGQVGNHAAGIGTVTVQGGSTWINNGDLYLGDHGEGHLMIADGGAVTSGSTSIGKESDSHGEVIVSGAAATWNATGGIVIGSSGEGSLRIEGGATVTAVGGLVSAWGGPGTLTVTGDGSLYDGGAANLYIANSGVGTVNILDGGTLNNAIGTVGHGNSGAGVVNVNGSPGLTSQWTNTDSLYIGGNQNNDTDGTGAVTVGADGRIDVTNTLKLWPGGTLNVTAGGLVTSDTGVIESASTATVAGTGATWANSGGLYVGQDGAGRLEISGGGGVSDAAGYIGKETGSTGTVTVDGAGSLWNNSGSLYVGGSDTANGGTGDVSISSGGRINVGDTLKLWSGGTLGVVGGKVQIGSPATPPTDGQIRIGSGGTFSMVSGAAAATGSLVNSGGALDHMGGTMTIDGGTFEPGSVSHNVEGTGNPELRLINGASWTAPGGEIRVGDTLDGTLRILSGSDVTNHRGRVGFRSTGIGTVIVDGAGSVWANTNDIVVGYHGTGTLNVINGGEVTSEAGGESGVVGKTAGASGMVLIDGAGSQWTHNTSLYVGGNVSSAGGDGTVTVSNGGQLDVSGTLKIWRTGRLNIDGGGVTAGSFDATATHTGKLGAGAALNGSGYFDVTHEAVPDQAPEYTYSAWFRNDAATGHHYVLESTPSTNNWAMASRVHAAPSDESMLVASRTKINTQEEIPTFSIAPTINDWNLFTVTYKEGVALRAYINGAFKGADNVLTSQLASTDGLNIASDRYGGRRWVGMLDDMAVWDRVLSDDEIAVLYNGGVGNPADSLLETNGLAAYWRFDEASGGVVDNAASASAALDAILRGSGTSFTDNGFDFTNGTLTVDGGIFAPVSAGASYILDGRATGSPTVNLINGASLTGIDQLRVQAGGEFNINGSTVNVNSVVVGSSIESGTGILRADGSGASLTTSGMVFVGGSGTSGAVVLRNGAQVSIGGDLRIVDSVVADSTGQVAVESGADVSIDDDVLIATGGLSGQTGTMMVTGSGTTFTQNGASGVIIGAASGSSGSLSVMDNAVFTTGTGGITVDNTGELTVSNGGQVICTSLDFSGGGTVRLLGGEMSAETIIGDLVNEDTTLCPGSSPGILTLTGNYTQQSGAALEIELGGLLVGVEYDRLVVSDLLTLGGDLNIVLINGFRPADGDTFDILDWGLITGAFDNVNPPDLDDGLKWDDSELYTDGKLTVTPEPATLTLLALGGLAMLRRKRR